MHRSCLPLSCGSPRILIASCFSLLWSVSASWILLTSGVKEKCSGSCGMINAVNDGQTLSSNYKTCLQLCSLRPSERMLSWAEPSWDKHINAAEDVGVIVYCQSSWRAHTAELRNEVREGSSDSALGAAVHLSGARALPRLTYTHIQSALRIFCGLFLTRCWFLWMVPALGNICTR